MGSSDENLMNLCLEINDDLNKVEQFFKSLSI